MSDLLEITARVDTRGVTELLNALHEAGGKAPPRMLRERAGALGRYLAENTQPVADETASINVGTDGKTTIVATAISADTYKIDGRGKSAHQLGVNAVVRDIRRVYQPPSLTFKALRARSGEPAAKAFIKFLKTGKYQEARQLLLRLGLNAGYLDIQPFDGGQLHQQRRNRRGRINRGNRPIIVADGSKLKPYEKMIVDRVGWAKSAWMNGASKIPGAKGLGQVPKWMRQPAPGRGIDQTGKLDPYIRLESLVGYAEDVLDQRRFNRAEAAFEESLIRELAIILDKIAAKSSSTLAK